MTNTTLKQRLTVKILDDTQLAKFVKLTKELENKKKALKVLTKELTASIKDGAKPHPDSLYIAQLEDKALRFTPAYKDMLLEEVGQTKFDKLIDSAKKAFDKLVKKGDKKPSKELMVKLADKK